jgi:hypothetical protein
VAVSLDDYVPALRREVGPPGSTFFDAVPDEVFTGYLADAFWEVRLDGFNEPWTCSEDGTIVPIVGDGNPDPQVDPPLTGYDSARDIPRDQIALVVLYAGIKIIRNRLLEQNTRLHAKAGPVEFSQESSANLLVEMLRELTAVKSRLLALKTYNQDVSVIDAFSVRANSNASYSGYLFDWVMSDPGLGLGAA